MSLTEETLNGYAEDIVAALVPYTHKVSIEDVMDTRYSPDEPIRTHLNDEAWQELRSKISERVDHVFRLHLPQVRLDIKNRAFEIAWGEDYVSEVVINGANVEVNIWNEGSAIRFRCKSCNMFSKLEVVQTEVIVTSIVNLIDEQTGYFETDHETVEIGGTPMEERFQCSNCGHVIAENIEDLAEWYDGLGRR